jgi:hypothetical protein
MFGNKEDCEDCMQGIGKIEPEEKLSKDQASYFEESSTQVFAQICILLIEDDVYSISNLFSEFHVEDIWHASQGSHADIFPCAMHVSQETKRESLTSDSILIFYEKHFHKQIGYLNSSQENIQFQKTNRPKRSPGSEVTIILKSTKLQRFSRNGHTVFKVSSKLYLDLLHYKKRNWICVDISMVHILHQIRAYIYIFNKIFNKHKLSQLRGLLEVEGQGCLTNVFCSFSFFFMHCNLRGGVFP